MKPFQEQSPVGATVRIAERAQLERFPSEWQFHYKLEAKQLSCAGRTARVRDVGFYHGGDVLYHLKGVPGVWHEVCLRAVDNPIHTI
jgi:hypothetical protein